MSSNWQAAVQSVNELIAENGEFLNTIYKIAASNDALGNQAVFEEALSQTAEVVSTYDSNTIDLKFLRSTAKDIHKHFAADDLSMFVEEREELVGAYTQLRSSMRSLSRTFGDIARKGPANEAEEILLVSAIAFLEPHEFQNAITTSLSPAKVADMIDASKIKQFTDIIMQNAGIERVEQAQEIQDAPMPNILGEKMGIIDSIQHGFESTPIMENASLDEVRAPKTPSMGAAKGRQK
ncbi:MAG: hypothetical protein K0R73_877 [Candidatus Midichloriaceae bacterium]|jgi:hypothetical protein|nr:hypothetical protein [Candidatus Midichloriaceae bacterium]